MKSFNFLHAKTLAEAARAATPVAGTLEVDIEFYVEDATGSNP